MAKLVSTPSQVERNILSYREFVSKDPDLINSLSMNRAWYAVKDGDAWRFGSSKIIGYVGLTPEEYDPYKLDGRQTEAVLQSWFAEVDPNDPHYDELWEGLTDFLDDFGKNPSKLARINILKSEVRSPEEDRADAICELILEVARGLDDERIRTLRKRLKALL